MDASLYSIEGEKPKFHLGQRVKLLKDIKNDGTYPFGDIGTLLMSAGSIGNVRKVGEFLQTIRVYEVHFTNMDMPVEIVGCREFELEPLEEFIDQDEEDEKWFKNHRSKKNKN